MLRKDLAAIFIDCVYLLTNNIYIWVKTSCMQSFARRFAVYVIIFKYYDFNAEHAQTEGCYELILYAQIKNFVTLNTIFSITEKKILHR